MGFITENTIKALQEFMDQESNFFARIKFFNEKILPLFLKKINTSTLAERMKIAFDSLSKAINLSDIAAQRKITEECFSQDIEALYNLIVKGNTFSLKIEAMTVFIDLYNKNQTEFEKIFIALSQDNDFKQMQYKDDLNDIFGYFKDIFILPAQHMGRYGLLFEAIDSKVKDDPTGESYYCTIKQYLGDICKKIKGVVTDANKILGLVSPHKKLDSSQMQRAMNAASGVRSNRVDLLAMPIAKILVILAIYLKLPLGYKLLSQYNLKFLTKSSVKSIAKSLSWEVLKIYFANMPGANNALIELICSKAQNISHLDNDFAVLIDNVANEKITNFTEVLKEIDEDKAKIFINCFIIQMLVAIFLQYNQMQAKRLVSDEKVRQDKIDQILRELDSLYHCKPDELEHRVNKALAYDPVLPKNLPEYLVELIRQQLTFGGSVEPKLQILNTDFTRVLVEAAKFLNTLRHGYEIVKDKKTDAYQRFFRVIYIDNEKHKPTVVTTIPSAKRRSENSAATVEPEISYQQDKLDIYKEPKVKIERTSEEEILGSTQEVILGEKKEKNRKKKGKEKESSPIVIRDDLDSSSLEGSKVSKTEKRKSNPQEEQLFSQISHVLSEISKSTINVWHPAIENLIVAVEKIMVSSNDTNNKSARYNQAFAKLITVFPNFRSLESNNLAASTNIVLSQENFRQEYAKLGPKVKAIVANLLKIADYYFNDPKNIHKRWQPQLSKLLHLVLAIYYDNNALFKEQRICHAIKQTITEIRSQFCGKGSRLAGSLSELFNCNVDPTYWINVGSKKLPEKVKEEALTEEEYDNCINKYHMANPDNRDMLVAGLFRILDYFENNRICRIYLKQLREESQNEIQSFSAKIPAWLKQEITNIRFLLCSVWEKNLSQVDILKNIDALVKKINGHSVFIPVEHKILAESLAQLSSSFGGASSTNAKNIRFPEVMLKPFSKIDAQAYLDRYQIEKFNKWDTGENKSSLVIMANIILLCTVYTNHPFGDAWLNKQFPDDASSHRNNSRKGWAKEASQLAREIIRLYATRRQDTRQYLNLLLADSAKNIAQQSTLCFFGGPRSTFAYTLRKFQECVEKRRTNIEPKGNDAKILGTAGCYDLRMDVKQAEDIVLTFAVHQVIDILSTYENLIAERRLKHTSAAKQKAISDILEVLKTFIDPCRTTSEQRKELIEQCNGIAGYIKSIIVKYTHIAGGFNPVFQDGDFGQILFGRENSVSAFLNSISAVPQNNSAINVGSPVYG